MNFDDIEIDEIEVSSGETSEALEISAFDETSTGETRVRSDSQVQVRDDDLPAKIGESLGGYTLESILGKGGMGCVFLGKHQVLKREAAVKVLASHLSGDEGYVSRFFHEAQIVNEVNHPNIVEIIDFVQTTEPLRVAYIMEVLKGQPLSSLVLNQRLTFKQSMNICFQLCDALVAVHQAGVVHRDLKPENIFVTAHADSDFSYVPSVKILDFGIAKKQTGDVSHQTATGAIIGTPAYMAPEQISGGKITDKTDVYAIGEILYEMLVGERLFSGENMEIMRSKLINEVPEFVLDPETPHLAQVDNLLKLALTQSPTKRPDMKQFARAILEYCPDIRPQRANSSAALLNPEQLIKTPLPTSLSTPIPPNMEISKVTEKKSKGGGLLGGLFVIIALIAGAAFFITSQDGRLIDAQTDAVPNKGTITPKKPQAAETKAVKSTAKPAAPEPKQPVLAEVKIVSEPNGAKVFDVDSGQLIGQTPLKLSVEKGIDKKVRLELTGYRSEVAFISSSDKQKGFVLDRVAQKVTAKPVVRSPQPTPAPKAKTVKPAKPASKQSNRDTDDPFSKREVPEW